VTDDFLPLEEGGFLVTQMGSHTGGTPGRVAEFAAGLQMIAEWPASPPQHDFNPHGISARPQLNLMVTSDFMMPASSPNIVPGDPLLRGIIRVWDFKKRSIVRTIEIPGAMGTMDVKLIPNDPRGRAFTAGMFDGLVYLVDTMNGTSQVVFDCEDVVPHVEVPVRGGMTQLLAMPRSGDRLIFACQFRVLSLSSEFRVVSFYRRRDGCQSSDMSESLHSETGRIDFAGAALKKTLAIPGREFWHTACDSP
jgi:selenium-binding protein 1